MALCACYNPVLRPQDGGGPDAGTEIDAAFVPVDALLNCPAPLSSCTTFTCAGGCFMHCEDLRSWVDAQSQCALWGGGLATICDEGTSQCLADVGVGWFGLSQPGPGEGTWLSACEGTTPFADWAAGEPNNSGASGNEDCGELLSEYDGVWNDADCATRLPFFCMWTP